MREAIRGAISMQSDEARECDDDLMPLTCCERSEPHRGCVCRAWLAYKELISRARVVCEARQLVNP